MLEQAGPYRLNRELRSDVLTAAYDARTADGERVVVIVGKSPVRLAPEEEELFRVEVEATRTHLHTHVEPVLAHGVQHGLPWVAHRYRPAWSLAEKVGGIAGGVPVPAMALLGLELASALEHAHAIEPALLHRGVSLSSAVLDEGLCVRLQGFGLAGVVLDGARRTPALARMVQREVAPEVADGVPLTAAVDLFALGVALHTMLRGKGPPGGATRLADASLSSRFADAPTELVELLERLLRRDPDKRGSAADAVSALRRLLDDPEQERRRVAVLLDIASTTVQERDGAPVMSTDATKETVLEDVLASMAPSRRNAPDTVPPPPSRPGDFDDPATVVEPVPQSGSSMREPGELSRTRSRGPQDGVASVGSTPAEIGRERQPGPDPGSAAPAAEDRTAPHLAAPDFVEDPTLVQVGGGTALLAAPTVPADVLSASTTKQLDLADVPGRTPDADRTIAAPQLDMSGFTPPSTTRQLWQRLSRTEVAGWPLPWLIGIGAVALAALVVSMGLGVWLAG